MVFRRLVEASHRVADEARGAPRFAAPLLPLPSSPRHVCGSASSQRASPPRKLLSRRPVPRSSPARARLGAERRGRQVPARGDGAGHRAPGGG